MTHGKDGMHSVNQSKHSERSELSELSRQETPLTFYEGKWVATNRTTRSLKNFIVKKERFFLKEMAAHRGLILDIGCGGGWSFFTLFDGVVGLDLSHTSLVNALDIYSSGVQGSSLKLPFQDESFDYVVSLDVLGHIHEDYKEQLLSEFFRVLKRGGSTLHYIETLSNDPISLFGRKHPDLNEKYIVAPEGHIGAEPPAVVFERFRSAGFVPVREEPCYKGFIYIDRFVQYFDNEFAEQSRLVKTLVQLFKPITNYRLLTLGANLFITLLFELCDPLLPDDWAGGALVHYQKP